MYEDRMMVFEKIPGAFVLYMEFEKFILARFPDAEIRPKKTQIGFFEGCGFAWASPPLRRISGKEKPCITITLGLPIRLDSPRVFAATQPYPGRWTHHFIISDPSELDAQFEAWTETAHEFALARKR